MSFMSDYGDTAADNGYRVIPIAPGTKRPGQYRDRQWLAYGDWSRHCQRDSKSFELNIWKRWPDAAVGIATGNVVGIDIDILDAEWAAKIEGLARKMLGDTPLVRYGMRPKRMLVYRADKPFAGWKPHPVEILAEGQQFVAYAIHPGTGSPYQWQDESPCDVDIDSLPVVTEKMCRAFAEAAHKGLPDHFKPERVSRHAGTGGGDTSAYGLRGTTEAIASALKFIKNDDVPWDDWFSIGMGIKGALGDAGWPLFADWSAQSTKHDDKETGKLWKSMKPRAKGAGSVYFIAQQNGWTPPAEVILNGDLADLEVVPADAIIANADQLKTQQTKGIESNNSGGADHPRNNLAGITCHHAPPPDDDPELPPDPEVNKADNTSQFLEVPGIVGDLTRWITDTAISPQPFLALGASLAAVGALMGRRYRTQTNLRSNLYIVGVAGSGGGKDHPRNCLREAFFQAGLFDYMGGNRIASGQAILSALNRHPAQLFQLDEFGHMLNQILSKRAAAHHQQIWTTLTELYTSAGSIFQGTEYADQKQRKREDIVQPCACLNATTVPGPLWQALENGALGDGSLARFLIFRSPLDYPDRCRGGLIEPPSTITEGLQAIARGVPDHDYGGDMAGLMLANSNPRPYVVPLTPAGEREMSRLEADQIAGLRHFSNSAESSIIARYVENASKLAMIYAVSRDPEQPVIDADALVWADKLVEHCVGTLLQDAERYISDNETEAKHKKVLRVIEDRGTIAKAELVRRTQWLSRREREEVLASLAEAGRVQIVQSPASAKGGRPAVRIVFLREEGSETVH